MLLSSSARTTLRISGFNSYLSLVQPYEISSFDKSFSMASWVLLSGKIIRSLRQDIARTCCSSVDKLWSRLINLACSELVFNDSRSFEKIDLAALEIRIQIIVETNANIKEPKLARVNQSGKNAGVLALRYNVYSGGMNVKPLNKKTKNIVMWLKTTLVSMVLSNLAYSSMMFLWLNCSRREHYIPRCSRIQEDLSLTSIKKGTHH